MPFAINHLRSAIFRPLHRAARPIRRRLSEFGSKLRWRLTPSAGTDTWVKRRLGLSDFQWVFLLGINNSGTSIVSRSIADHPQASAQDSEGQYCTRAFPRPDEYGVMGLWSEREDLFRWTTSHNSAPARRAQFDWARKLTPAQFIIEKVRQIRSVAAGCSTTFPLPISLCLSAARTPLVRGFVVDAALR